MACHADVVQMCMLSRGDDRMPCPTSSDRVCFLRSIMSYHTRYHTTVYAAQGPCGHATPYVVWSCVLPKGHMCMPFPMSSNCMCSPRAIIECHSDVVRSCVLSKGDDNMHARRYSTVCATHGRWWLAKTNVVLPCLLSKGNDGMRCPTLSDRLFCLLILV